MRIIGPNTMVQSAPAPTYHPRGITIPTVAYAKRAAKVVNAGPATMARDAREAHAPHVAQVRATQTYLRNRGYNVKVDGNHGPQTKAAIAAIHNNVHPVKFNNAAKKGGGWIQTRSGPVHVPASNNRAPAAAAAPPTTSDPNAGAGTDPTAGQPFDPVAMAQAQIEAVYGPQEAALQQQMANAQAAGEAGTQNLNKWYGDVANTQQAAAASNAVGNQAILGAAGATDANILGLFGGPQGNAAAGEAAAYGDIGRTEIAQTGQATQGFDSAMAPIIGLQKTDALANNAARTQANLADLASQMQALQASKAQDFQSAVAKATSDYNNQINQQNDYNLRLQDAQHSWAHTDLQDQIATQQANMAAALMPGKARAQALSNANVSSTIANRAYQAKLDAKKYGITAQNALNNSRRTDAYISSLKQKMAQSAKANANGGLNWNDPNTIGQLQDNLRGLIQGKRGGFRMHPGLAEQNLYASLASLNVPKPVASKVATTLMLQTLNNSHGLGSWRHFGINANGRVVRTSRQPAPKKK